VTYVKLDDAFAENDLVIGLTDKAFRLYIAALCSCSRNLTDGVVSVARLTTLRAQTRATNQHANELVLAGLWEGEGPWEIVGYLTLNNSKERVESIREERREAGRIGGKRSGESRRAEANAEAISKHVASRLLEPQTETQSQSTENPVRGERTREDENTSENGDASKHLAGIDLAAIGKDEIPL